MQNTVINYFVCDAKFDWREGCYVCIETTMTKMNKICRPNVLKVRRNHNTFLCFPVFEH